MLKRDFLLNAFNKSTVYYRAEWVFALFTVVRGLGEQPIKDPYDYMINQQDGKYVFWLENQWVPIEDSPPITQPLYRVEEGILLQSQADLIQPCTVPFPFTTRVGTLFTNYYCLVSAFGDKIVYQNGKISISKLEEMIAPRIINPDEDKPDGLLPADVKKFSSACQSMAGFSSIASPSASEYTVQPAPGIDEFKAQLLEKYKDQLNDPAIIAIIDKALVDYDKAFQAQDPEGGFYMSGKAFDVSRKKLFSMHGLEQPEVSGGKATLITNSLSEGWDVTKLPAMNDSLRDGSFNRGALTALGGESVKFIFRIFATTKATEDDCGSTVGVPYLLTERIAKRFEGHTLILKNGQQVLLDKTNMSNYLNQPVMIRTPATCKTGYANFCYKCLGEKLRMSGNSLAALASDVGSAMMYVFMKKMHGTSLKTAKWNIEETIN